MNKNSKIYIAGHHGMVGSAILRNLKSKGYANFVLRTIDELDLTRQADVEAFFEKERPEYVVDAAAKVGGIMANSIYRAQFIYENLTIQNNIIHSAWKYGVKKLLFLGSSCIYPKLAPQPIKEDSLLTGLLEPTNEPYAIAKITGIKMCESYYRQYGSDFISVMPTNLYGPNDNYNLETSHVLPALIRKFHLGKCMETNDWEGIRKDLDKRPIEGISGQANETDILNILNKYGISNTPSSHHPITPSLQLWGTGSIYREFMHVDDMASACVFILQKVSSPQLYDEYKHTHINIGTGTDLTIKDVAMLIKKITGFRGNISWDASKPDGTPKKLLDISLLSKLGFKSIFPLEDGINSVYKHYIDNL